MKHINHLSAKSYFINHFGELSTSFIFFQMQEIAWEHANILDMGFKKLKNNNLFWVLSRLQLKILQHPIWGEKFSLETWYRGTDGFFCYRDFNFKDQSGNIIIQATSSWLVLNSESKKIIRLFNHNDNTPQYTESIFGKNPNKVSAPKSEQKLNYTPALFSEIDINQHFNSGKYIDRIINSYSYSFHEKHRLSELEINFLKEGMPQDNLGIKKQKIDKNQHLCSVVREKDNADLVRARLFWYPRE